ncbi:helix-turn-helix domain-containing protein [Fusobacterium ulcerans]|uniref:helix-turn-helix domain-containing protein n=1 Tax=Fusobacterium ulcerans TaxID=861 RepID=UPI0030ECE9F7
MNIRTTGEILKEKRKLKNLKVQDIADFLEVTQPYVTLIENNEKRPSKNYLKEIKDVLRLTENEIKEIEEYEKFRRLPLEFQKKLEQLSENKNLKKEIKLGDLLKELREKKGYSLKKLENLSGVSQSYISDIENGIRGVVPKREKLDMILKTLNPNEEMKEKVINAYADALLTPEMKQIIKKDIRKIEKNNSLELSILLKQLRESRNITIKELSEKSGVNASTISEIERGANKAKVSTMEKICLGLNTNVEEREDIFLTLVPKDIKNKFIDMRKALTVSFPKGYSKLEKDEQKLIEALINTILKSKNI